MNEIKNAQRKLPTTPNKRMSPRPETPGSNRWTGQRTWPISAKQVDRDHGSSDTDSTDVSSQSHDDDSSRKSQDSKAMGTFSTYRQDHRKEETLLYHMYLKAEIEELSLISRFEDQEEFLDIDVAIQWICFQLKGFDEETEENDLVISDSRSVAQSTKERSHEADNIPEYISFHRSDAGRVF